jgi:hypothetical protein
MTIFDATAPKKLSNVEKVIGAAARWASALNTSSTGLVGGLTGQKVGSTLAARGNVSDETLNALVQQAQQDASPDSGALDALSAPYRVLVARPLSTAFLASNRKYQQDVTQQESTEGFIPAIDIALSAVQNPEAWRKAWLDARHVSPGQAIVGYVGDNIDGTQATDKIDWTNKEQVDVYFSQLKGLKYVSAAIDLTLNVGADPAVLAGAGAGALTRKLITVPVTNKNIAKTVSNIDDAAAGKSSPWNTQFGYYKENADDLSPILAHTVVAGNVPLGTQIQKAAQIAVKTGDDTKLAQVLKIAVGDSKTIDELIYSDYLLSADEAVLLKESESILNTIKYLDEVSPITGSESAMLLKLQRETAAKRAERIKIDLEDVTTENNIVQEILREVPAGSIARQTASPFTFVENMRAKGALTYSKQYWGTTEETGRFTKVANAPSNFFHYLSPSATLKEFPAGHTPIGGIAGDNSALEYAARVRLWGRLTGKSGALQKKYSELYAPLQTKTERFQHLEKWDEKAMKDIVVTNMRDEITSPLRKEIISEVGRVFASTSITRRERLVKEVIESNYTISDGVGGTVLIKLIKDTVDEAALQIAKSKRGVSAKVTEDDIAQAKAAVLESYSKVPVRSSQVPGAHFGVNLVDFDNAIAENSERIKLIVDEIELAIKLDPSLLKNKNWTSLIKQASDDVLEAETITERVTTSGLRISKDSALKTLDVIYSDIWKPTTLASFHYTTRNLAEGSGRAVAVALEVSRDFDIPVTRILRSAYSEGVASRVFKNIDLRAEAKSKRIQIKFLKKQIGNDIVEKNGAIVEALYQSNDSAFAALGETLVQADDIARIYSNSTLHKDVVDFARNLSYRLATAKDRSLNINTQLYTHLVNNDVDAAWEVIASAGEEYTIRTLGAFQGRLRKERVEINKIISSPAFESMPAGMQDSLKNMGEMLKAADISLQSVATASVGKARIRNKLEGLISGANITRNIERSAEGEFELFPGSGLMVSDAFSGALGAIMRQESSAAASGASIVLDINRGTMGALIDGKVKRGIVRPYDKNGRIVPEWAGNASDYANRQMFDESTRRLAMIDVKNNASLDTVIAWAKSRNPDAVKWRSELENEIETIGATSPDPIAEIVTRNSLFIESTLPMYGADGNVIAPLLDELGDPVLTEAGKLIPGTNIIAEESGQLVPGLRIKALEGKLTPEDMMLIPERQRASVNGAMVERNNGNLWRRGVQTMFKYIGSLPEDTFIRHPFYRMMFQTEQRRIAGLWKTQGRSDNYIDAHLDELRDSAHRFAYKQTMERLYSVQRKTNPAQMLRFVSPFYMAKQNSNRFWFGYSMRNPQFIGRYLQFWSAPGKMFDVENENGQDVGTPNPFFSEGIAAKVTIPKLLADMMGIPEDQRFSTQLSSWDLINNGYMPFIPEGGGGAFDVSISWLFNKASGKPYDPELLLTKFGMDPELVRKLIAPYANASTNISERDQLLNFLITPNSWMRSGLAAASGAPIIGSVASFVDPKASERLVNRTIKNYKYLYEQYLNEQEYNVAIDEKQQNDELQALWAEANSMAINEFLWEGFLQAAPGIGSIKIEEYADRKAAELRNYEQQWGQDEGMTRFVQDNTKMTLEGEVTSYGEYTYITAKSGGADNNKFGVFASPQTMRGIEQNRELWNDVSRITGGPDGTPDGKILGSLFNIGDRQKDFSATVNNKLYKEGIKQKIPQSEQATISIAVDTGNSEYFAMLDGFDAEAESLGIVPGSDAFNSKYGKDIDDAEKSLGDRNPIWFRNSGSINLLKADNNVKTILNVLGDEKFMSTVGKKSPVVQGLAMYMNGRSKIVESRLQLSEESKNPLGTNIYRTKKFTGIVTEKEALAQSVIAEYPDFAPFYNYYLKRDALYTDGFIAEIK